MAIDNEGNPVDDGYCGTHQWVPQPCPKCETFAAARRLITDGELVGMCPVCTGEFLKLTADHHVCRKCNPLVPNQTGLL